MSDPNVNDLPDDEDLDDDEPEAQPESSVIKDLRKQNKQLAKEIAEARADRKAAAFERAGIDTTTGMGKFVFDKYDGDATSEAVKAFWSDLNPGGATTPTAGEPDQPTEQIPEGERQMAAARRDVATGALPDTGEGISQRAQALEVAQKQPTYEKRVDAWLRNGGPQPYTGSTALE
jgi:hypothetical protein